VAAGRKNVLTMTRNWEEEQSKAAIGHAAADGISSVNWIDDALSDLA
jgi:hypothetical protein